MEDGQDKKFKILKEECLRENKDLLQLVEEVYNHLVQHPNQEDETMSFQIQRIIQQHIK